MPYMYILECADGSFYVGSTWDVDRRLWQHNAGEGAEYTKRRRPVKLVYVEESPRIADAYAREKQVQGWNRAKRLALIEGRLDELPSLSSRAASQRPAAEPPL
jgi:putative endonuclease